MARRLIISERAGREIGEAYEWYEEQLPGLGAQFLEILNVQFFMVRETPHLCVEVIPGVRRALLPRFPYGILRNTG